MKSFLRESKERFRSMFNRASKHANNENSENYDTVKNVPLYFSKNDNLISKYKIKTSKMTSRQDKNQNQDRESTESLSSRIIALRSDENELLSDRFDCNYTNLSHKKKVI